MSIMVVVAEKTVMIVYCLPFLLLFKFGNLSPYFLFHFELAL